MNYFVKHKQSGAIFLVCADNPVQAESLVVGTVPWLSGDYVDNDFFVEEEPIMASGSVLELRELEDCRDAGLRDRILKGQI